MIGKSRLPRPDLAQPIMDIPNGKDRICSQTNSNKRSQQ